MNSYKEKVSLSERLEKVSKNEKRFKGRTVIVVCIAANNAPELKNPVFVFPVSTHFVSVAASIRRNLEENMENGVPLLQKDEALFYFVNNTMACSSNTVGQVYKTHHDKEDNILYVTYTKESTFG